MKPVWSKKAPEVPTALVTPDQLEVAGSKQVLDGGLLQCLRLERVFGQADSTALGLELEHVAYQL